MTQRLVLVGGGHAHLSVLRAIAQRPLAQTNVVLITPFEHQNYSGMLPGWIAGHYRQTDCRVDLRPLVQAAGAKLVLAQVHALDAVRRIASLADGLSIDYDLLSMDVGSETDTFGLDTLGHKLLPIKPLDGFFSAWPEVLARARAKPDYRLIVVGAGAAAVEIALAAQHAFTREVIDARVDLVASESGFLAGHAAKVQARLQRLTGRAGLGLHFLRGVGTEEGVLLADGRLLGADDVIAATGARSPAWLWQSQLARDDGGYILVDRHQRSMSHPDVFAAGDVCARQDVVMARSGVHAVHAGAVLANNLLATLKGRPLASYQPKSRSLSLLACGPRYAVASWGPWSAEGRWVWRWKDWIDRGFIRRFSCDAPGQHETNP